MKRMTDRKLASELKRNAEGLIKAGIEPSISDLRYIKLAEYENKEEDEPHLRFGAVILKAGEKND